MAAAAPSTASRVRPSVTMTFHSPLRSTALRVDAGFACWPAGAPRGAGGAGAPDAVEPSRRSAPSLTREGSAEARRPGHIILQPAAASEEAAAAAMAGAAPDSRAGPCQK